MVKYVELAKLTGKIRNQRDELYQKDWSKFILYMKEYYKYLKTFVAHDEGTPEHMPPLAPAFFSNLLFLSSALPLYCRHVYNSTGLTYVHYVKKPCNLQEDSCVASVLRTNIVKFQEELLNKCSSSRYCSPGHYSFTAGDGKFFQMKKHCCRTKMCNNALLSLPDRNMLAENGLQCPSCFSKGTIMCKSEKTINCLENETQCIQSKVALLIGALRPHSFTFRGCGTTDFCAIGKRQRKITGDGYYILSVTQESCYNASKISHQPEHEE
ncbi:phospholipase A2 inhibitor and Ly6/PLAUR domain-containing protein-like [Podarcis raffonei]|uniref:phospholipase A2 inhibitor and Ly6/PLAUR domain-containing protein-like n=1 Tax=Podarcis raffonei TaxID=65483 RepID=UPI0023296D10|nr:phospholipase A2 inhibitor and Ly6/PLAUR domain-containing protein-like [Podarcis raffonei]